MCDQEHAESIIHSCGLKSAPIYTRAWRQLSAGLKVEDAIAALCDFDTAYAWVTSEKPNANTRQSFLAKCLWPFDHVTALSDHPARPLWRAAHDSMKNARVPLVPVCDHPDFQALSEPQHGGGDSDDAYSEADRVSATAATVATVVTAAGECVR